MSELGDHLFDEAVERNPELRKGLSREDADKMVTIQVGHLVRLKEHAKFALSHPRQAETAAGDIGEAERILRSHWKVRGLPEGWG